MSNSTSTSDIVSEDDVSSTLRALLTALHVSASSMTSEAVHGSWRIQGVTGGAIQSATAEKGIRDPYCSKHGVPHLFFAGSVDILGSVGNDSEISRQEMSGFCKHFLP